MKAKEIQDLINFISESGLDEVNIETGEFKLKVKKNSEVKTQIIESTPAVQAPTPVVAAAAITPAPSAPPAESADNGASSNYVEVKSPMIGTFYRASGPDVASFVEVGDKVVEGQTVCIVEAMKLFNEIESDISGTIVKVLVDNSSPVEYDQPLFLVDPS